MKELSSKLEMTSQQLDDLKRRGTASEDELILLKEREARWEAERRNLQVGL